MRGTWITCESQPFYIDSLLSREFRKIFAQIELKISRKSFENVESIEIKQMPFEYLLRKGLRKGSHYKKGGGEKFLFDNRVDNLVRAISHAGDAIFILKRRFCCFFSVRWSVILRRHFLSESFRSHTPKHAFVSISAVNAGPLQRHSPPFPHFHRASFRVPVRQSPRDVENSPLLTKWPFLFPAKAVSHCQRCEPNLYWKGRCFVENKNGLLRNKCVMLTIRAWPYMPWKRGYQRPKKIKNQEKSLKKVG